MVGTWRPLALLLLLLLLLTAGNAQPLPSTGEELKSYLLLDSRNVQDNGGTRLVLGPVRKHGKPVLTEEEQWVRAAAPTMIVWPCCSHNDCLAMTAPARWVL